EDSKIHRGESSAAGRQARRHLLFQAAQRPGVLREVRRRGASEKILKLAANISGDKLVSLGTCFGKFTKTHKFRLHITALDYLAPYAKYKVWIKPGAEQSFLYGNHVLKSGLGRITENTSQYQGVVVYSMADVPLGFGVAAKSTQDCRKVDPMAIVVFHQADIGEYVRHEETLT
uniref:60S ribosome subunit biogenesis protein NIP7 homolog n=1 Tax=Bos taurus TaxID=9913 RepID=A0ABI0P150_BOVIN